MQPRDGRTMDTGFNQRKTTKAQINSMPTIRINQKLIIYKCLAILDGFRSGKMLYCCLSAITSLTKSDEIVCWPLAKP